MKSIEAPLAPPSSSVALCSAQTACLPQSPHHGYRHIPSSDEIMCLMFQLPDVRDRVCFYFIPVPDTVTGTQQAFANGLLNS